MANQSMDERQRETLKRIFSAGLAAVDPKKAVRSFLTRTGANLQSGDRRFSLEDFAIIYLIGAGAFADGSTCRQARRLGMQPLDYLSRNDSYNFFQGLGLLFHSGPTRTNVMDVICILID